MPRKPIDLTQFGPLYHDYSFFGATGTQLPGIYGPNQATKAPIITAYMSLALAQVLETVASPSFVELFCADAYYAMVASRLGATSTRGIDNNRDSFGDHTLAIAERLGIDGFELVEADLSELPSLPTAHVVANVGGLYHVSNPEEVLQASYALAERYLIVQSVVSLATDDEDYFQAPAPGWHWGSRYSVASFDAMVRDQGWKLLAWHRNELRGNTRPEDRGSVYYLIEK